MAEALKVDITLPEPEYTPQEYHLFETLIDHDEITKTTIFEHLQLNKSIQEQGEQFLLYKYFVSRTLGLSLSGQKLLQSSEDRATRRRQLSRSTPSMNTSNQRGQNLGQAYERLSMELLRKISEYLSWEDYSTRKPIDILQKNLLLLEEFKDFVKDKKMQEKISAVLSKQRE